MPTYEYRCKDCGHDLEAQQAFTDDPLTECPSCGGQLKKKFSAVGISFKGSGFYKTDSRGSKSSTTPSTTSSSDGGSDSSSGSADSSTTSDSSTSSSGTSSSSTTTTTSTTTSTDSGPKAPAKT